MTREAHATTQANQHIALECRHAREAAAQMIEWLDERRGGRREQDSLLRADMVRAVSDIAALSRAIERPGSIALLGSDGEQIDLILGALTGTDPKALAQFHGGLTRLPAITGLLPRAASGQRSGPAAILRYTHENPADAAATAVDTVGRLLLPVTDDANSRGADGAVRLQLLSLSDVIDILGRAYFANVRGDNIERVAADVAQELVRIKAEEISVVMQTGLAAHHVHELRRSFERRFRGHPTIVALAASGYWDTFAAFAPRLSVEGRHRIVSLLWGRLADFDALFGELSHALDGINHAVDVLCPAESVRSSQRASGWGEAHPASVLSAETLLGANAGADEMINVRTRFGQPCPVTRANLAMLVFEARLRLEGDLRAPMAKTDIIRLPAADIDVHPRNASSGAEQTRQPGPWLARAFLQAKSLHLCDAVVASHDATAMVVSMAPDEPLGDAFVPMLDDWVAASAGRTPAARETNDVGLFIAAGADRTSGKPTWSVLEKFTASVGPEVDWLDNWGGDRTFDHVFLLGAPALSNGSSPASVVDLATLQQTSDQGTLRHVRNAATALEEALRPGDGGLRYLAQSIAAIDCERVKNRQIANRLAETRKGLVDAVRRFLLAGHPAEDGDWRLRQALATQSRLGTLTRQDKLGRLIAALGIGDAEIKVLFHQVAAESKHIDVKSPIDAEHASRLAARFSARVLELWLHAMRNLAAARSSSQRFGFSEPAFAHLIDEIIIGAMRLDIRQRIASATLEAMAAAPRDIDQQAARADAQARDVIATYLSHLGFDNPWSTRHPKRRGTVSAPLFERRLPAGGVNTLPVRDLARRLVAQYGADWCEAFTVLTEDNIAASRGMRFEDREFREMEELLIMLGSNARELTL